MYSLFARSGSIFSISACANFLGQSNLIKGTISGNDGDSQIVDLYGQKISLPKSRSHAVDSSTYAGIRPEKFRISLLETPVKGNVLSGGKIEDVSYIGVSTQYQVVMPFAYKSPEASSVLGSIRSIEAKSGSVINGKKL